MEKVKQEDFTEMIKEHLSLSEKMHPGFSIDCVIITFFNNSLKILLNKLALNDKWMLPGGFIYKEENIEQAAYRILKDRTNLSNVYLEQFYTFGESNRTNPDETAQLYARYGLNNLDFKHEYARFISTGYLAFVKYEKVILRKKVEDVCQWFNLNEIPSLYADHNKIIKKALQNIRQKIEYLPIGYELLPDKFTITELRKIYEGFLGVELDRRNFQKKMLASELIIKLDERKETGSYPAPLLFSFNKKKIKEMKNDMQ